MKKLKINNFKILLDDEDFDLVKNEKIYVEKSRDSYIIRICFSKKFRPVLSKYLLNEYSYRIGNKDKNPFNLQKVNLYIKDENNKKRVHKNWVENNRQKINRNSKLWVKNNRAAAYLTRKKYSKTEKAKFSRKMNLNKIENRFRRAKEQAKYRNKTFNISFKNYKKLLGLPCYYCAGDISKDNGVGLDRINNAKGYHLSNVLPCCGNCNRTRSDIYTVEETKVMITALINYKSDLVEMDKKDEKIAGT